MYKPPQMEKKNQLLFKNLIKRKATETIHGKQCVSACYVKHIINMKWYIIQNLKQKHLELQLLCMGVHSKPEQP